MPDAVTLPSPSKLAASLTRVDFNAERKGTGVFGCRTNGIRKDKAAPSLAAEPAAGHLRHQRIKYVVTRMTGPWQRAGPGWQQG